MGTTLKRLISGGLEQEKGIVRGGAIIRDSKVVKQIPLFISLKTDLLLANVSRVTDTICWQIVFINLYSRQRKGPVYLINLTWSNFRQKSSSKSIYFSKDSLCFIYFDVIIWKRLKKTFKLVEPLVAVTPK